MFKKLLSAVVALGCLGFAGFGVLALQPAMGKAQVRALEQARANVANRPTRRAVKQVAGLKSRRPGCGPASSGEHHDFLDQRQWNQA